MSIGNASPITNFKLRVSPWWTDACVAFLNNLFKWYPAVAEQPLTVLEFGGGNSTLFFLQKGFKTITVENDEQFIKLLSGFAIQSGLNVHLTDILNFDRSHIDKFDLILVKANNYDSTVKLAECPEIDAIIRAYDWTIIVDDGIARKQVLEGILSAESQAIIVLDNIEFCANWGHLDTPSAKPDLIRVYREMLRSSDWRHYIFEQKEGREGRGVADISGWESPHRWASAILWHQRHLLAELMITHLGFPVVNTLGINNEDLQTLEARCPFDWENGKWLKNHFPPELDLKLQRKFD
jgi:hypothetical protein